MQIVSATLIGTSVSEVILSELYDRTLKYDLFGISETVEYSMGAAPAVDEAWQYTRGSEWFKDSPLRMQPSG